MDEAFRPETAFFRRDSRATLNNSAFEAPSCVGLAGLKDKETRMPPLGSRASVNRHKSALY